MSYEITGDMTLQVTKYVDVHGGEHTRPYDWKFIKYNTLMTDLLYLTTDY